jgi:1-acyl-sn-glycerol-3-phosphate acyltransferase
MSSRRWPVLRRLVVDPLFVVLALVLLALSPLLLALAAVASLPVGAWRMLRLAWLALVYIWCDAAGLVAFLGLWLAGLVGRAAGRSPPTQAEYAVIAWFLRVLEASARRWFGFRPEVQCESERLPVGGAGQRPLIVLSRHGGFGDSFMVAHLVMCRLRLRPRIVLTARLQLDPLIDVFGHRLPNCFVERLDDRERIGALAAGAGPGDGILLFPEGANVTQQRRRRAIERLRRRGRSRQAESAERMAHLAAPHAGGALTAIEAAPDADVLFVAHALLPTITGASDLVHKLPLTRPVILRLWWIPRSELGGAVDEEWLFRWWERLDRWIDDHETQALNTDGAPLP